MEIQGTHIHAGLLARVTIFVLVGAMWCVLASSASAADATPPSGVTLSVPTASTNDSTVAISGDPGSDPDSGIASWRIERQTATLASDTCGAGSTWTQVGATSPTGAVLDGLADATCYRYRFVSVNGDGLATVVEQDGALKVDRSNPTVSLDPPSGPLVGTVTLTGTANDALTRLASVTVLVDGRYSICPSAQLASDGRWTCAWRIGELEAGPATLAVVATDLVGQRAQVSMPVTILKPPSPFGPRPEDVDNLPPVVGLARIPIVSWIQVATVKPSAYDDRPGIIDLAVEHQRVAAVGARFSPWQPSYEETTTVRLPRRGETNCWRGIAIDAAGNRAVSDPRCTTLPLDDIDFAATGSWTTLRARSAYRQAVRSSSRRGSALTIKVAGSRPVLVVTRCPSCGTIRVLHGRRVLGTYKLAARRTAYRQLIALPRLVRPAAAPIRVVTASDAPVQVDGLVPGR